LEDFRPSLRPFRASGCRNLLDDDRKLLRRDCLCVVISRHASGHPIQSTRRNSPAIVWSDRAILTSSVAESSGALMTPRRTSDRSTVRQFSADCLPSVLPNSMRTAISTILKISLISVTAALTSAVPQNPQALIRLKFRTVVSLFLSFPFFSIFILCVIFLVLELCRFGATCFRWCKCPAQVV